MAWWTAPTAGRSVAQATDAELAEWLQPAPRAGTPRRLRPRGNAFLPAIKAVAPVPLPV